MHLCFLFSSFQFTRPLNNVFPPQVQHHVLGAAAPPRPQTAAAAAAAGADPLDAAAAQQLLIADDELQHVACQAVEQPDPNAAYWQQLSFSNR